MIIFSAVTLADVQKDIQLAKQKYEQSVATDREGARLVYITKLANLLSDLIDDRMSTGHSKNPEYFDLLYTELKLHPAPQDSDSKVFSQLRVGRWESPRHEYEYRSDGTWNMLPFEPGITSGHWRIEGNKYFDGIESEFDANDQFTIILLTKRYFILTNGTNVFFEARMPQ